jgi:DNA-binding MarR family transcriptional regulator
MNTSSAKNIANMNEEMQELRDFYVSMLSYIERLHRLMLDVIKAELDNHQIIEVNAVQALLLHNIGLSELTAGELKTRGYYQGSNVSYNLKKLVDMGYIHYERSHIDRRSVRIKLTDAGQNIHQIVTELYAKQTFQVHEKRIIDIAGLEDICLVCRDFERFWTDSLRYSD